jgi:hypothetical protein
MKINLLIIKLDLTKLRATRQGLGLFIDLLMIFLVLLNLGLIFFDWSFSFDSFRSVVRFISEDFEHWYAHVISPRTSFLDLIFVSIFLTELLIRWGFAIHRKTYDKWFFYPFIHWYDVLGCIPMSGVFKAFRLFRIIGMVSRLHNLGIINLKETYIYRKLRKYIDIFIEEISDSVVLNVLNGVQNEVKKGNPVVEKIARQVIVPRQDDLNDWLSTRISQSVSSTYTKHRLDFYDYLKDVITRSVKENQEIKRIALIPGVGKLITDILDQAISNVTFNVIDNIMEDVAKGRNLAAIQDISEQIISNLTSHEHDNEQLSLMLTEVVSESLEVVKAQVRVKQWRINELLERKAKLQGKIERGRGNAEALQAEIDIIDEDLREIKGE